MPDRVEKQTLRHFDFEQIVTLLMTLIKCLILLEKYQTFEYILQTEWRALSISLSTHTHTHTHTHSRPMKQKGKVIVAGRTGIYRG